MRIITDPAGPLDFETSAGIGNFDGLHLGHRKIIDAARRRAGKGAARSCVVTFDPHPQKVLAKSGFSLIHPAEERLDLLASSGVDAVVRLTFTEELSRVGAERFVKDVLVGRLRVRTVVVGPGFFFGRGREGDAGLLGSMGASHGFETVVAEPARVDGETVSSSLVRDLVAHGEVGRAGRLLGYDYYLRGVVVEGRRRGREIGFPTLNVETGWELLPAPGVYATYVRLADGFHGSVTNIGVRPTFGESALVVETHVFGFDGDLYGERVRVNFVDRIRDERRFESAERLVEQIGRDVRKVSGILSSRPKDERIWK